MSEEKILVMLPKKRFAQQFIRQVALIKLAVRCDGCLAWLSCS